MLRASDFAVRWVLETQVQVQVRQLELKLGNLWTRSQPLRRLAAMRSFTLLAVVSATQNVLWLPLGDSITFGCTGPTIQDCHPDCGGYRVPLAFALSQPALGDPTNAGFNITTMGTDRTGPSFVPSQWTRHCGFPGWTIPMIDNFLPKAFASNPARAFLSRTAAPRNAL